MRPKIDFMGGTGGEQHSDVTFATCVGGPRDGERELLVGRVPPASMLMPEQSGVYEKGVRCADDGALRYVWVPSDERP